MAGARPALARQIEEKELDRLVSALTKLMSKDPGQVIDLEVSWPPEGSVHFAALDGFNQLDWSHRIRTTRWEKLAGGETQEAYEKLFDALCQLFRRAWRRLGRSRKGANAYLRLPDQESSVDLSTGKELDDIDRPSAAPTKRAPPRRHSTAKAKAAVKPKKSKPKTNRTEGQAWRDGEKVFVGDTLTRVKKVLRIKEDPDLLIDDFKIYFLNELGLQIGIDGKTVKYVRYQEPFRHKVRGIWIGARDWEVEEELGKCSGEVDSAFGRKWRYRNDGKKLDLLFTRRNRVYMIEIT